MNVHDLNARARRTYRVVHCPEGYRWQARYWVDDSVNAFPTESEAWADCVAQNASTLLAGEEFCDNDYRAEFSAPIQPEKE